MKDLDDILSEEMEEQHKELINLLHQAYRHSLALTASTQEQAIQCVGERLEMMEKNGTLSKKIVPGQLNIEQALLREFKTIETRPPRGKRAMHFFNTLAAVLVVGLLIGASIVLFTNRSQSTIEGSVSTSTTAHVEAGGLEMSMRVTPGPYFLSELVVADMVLTNHTQTTFMLEGGGNKCNNPVLFLDQTGGASPHYTIPLQGRVVLFGCRSASTEFKPGQTLTVQRYEPLMNSGHVTLTARARFLKIESGNPTNTTSPLDRHWPVLQLQVNTHISSNRLFSLHQKGSQILVDAPPTANLVYQIIGSCGGASATVGTISWEAMSTHVLNVPGNLEGCLAKDRHWQYAISAAGYAIVAGKYPA